MVVVPLVLTIASPLGSQSLQVKYVVQIPDGMDSGAVDVWMDPCDQCPKQLVGQLLEDVRL